ncbi:helix-turn-helix transcriptional regulator [Ramlibacter sp. AW1]|uniref:Helix-turn-helix transcriptional regulator n=1 Tax=Ramlibacter aurantiacus TaxID=2801330 RepID=A0A937D763_9BURK|nr:AraC family transcriptional regulator [Ramlibacter aurantiacus]MBL0420606.1 helix-turn-helix transcriptional regulator [Ramlibacter aurantiacus]
MAGASAAPARYQGDFLGWDGGALLIGSGAAPIEPHAHYAIQLVVGAPGGLRVQFGRHAGWQEVAGALVPSRATHTIDVSACEWTAVVFIEPETAQGRALAARLQRSAEPLPAETVRRFGESLARAWRVERDADAVRAVCTGFITELAQTAPRDVSDPRVLQAIEFLRTRLGGPVSLDEVAAQVHLSPSRFRHLFVDQTGMPLRTYLLWRRLLQVWEEVMDGETLAGAAHAAGFADSAHLSRTARTMFGLPPSAMQMSGPLKASRRAGRPHRG